MSMLRPSSRLVSRVCRAALLRHSSRQIPRAFLYPSSSFHRCFSSKENNNEEQTATVTFSDESEHQKQSSGSTQDVDVSVFTQEVNITMPDMGESTGTFLVVNVMIV